MPQYTVNLDLPPLQRWNEVCSNSTYQGVVQYIVNTLVSFLGDGAKEVAILGRVLNNLYFPQEYAQELVGCAGSLGVDYGWLSILNIGYEVSDACTSMVAQTVDGKIYHARNMDFWEGMGFTASLREVLAEINFTKGGKTQYIASTFVGFVGILTGMRPNGFSITINTRFYPDGLSELFYEVIAAIQEKNASLVTFLSRYVLAVEHDFEAAVENLSNIPLIADVYYTIAGISANQGAVISRNRLNATDVWRLQAPSRWYLVETNYDHWEQPPWFDDRVTPSTRAMNALGQSALTLKGMYDVMSIKPILNLQTVYTLLACPADNSYTSIVRFCNYPCSE